jgi:signal transduction histidine kinase
MKLPGETWLPRLIIIAPLVTLTMITAAVVYLYPERLNHCFEAENGRFLDASIEAKRSQGETFVGNLKQLFTDRNSHLEKETEASVKERVDIAYETAAFIYDKYSGKLSDKRIRQRITDALDQMVWNKERHFVWITDYEGNSILDDGQQLDGANIASYTDAGGRAIILEEIQTVRRDGEGFLRTRFREEEGEQIMFVKDFGHFEWFFGSAFRIDDAKDALKASLLRLVREIPTDETAFVAVYDKEKQPLYISEGAGAYLNGEGKTGVIGALKEEPHGYDLWARNALVHSDYFAPFGWYLLYGSDMTQLKKQGELQRMRLAEKINYETVIIVASAAVLGLLITLFSLLASQRIKALFAEYSEEVRVREEFVRELNASFETRLRDEVEAKREDEKILIQQSKMTAMGEMLSMIRYQWRQPLERLSSLFLNIAAAYENKELTREYLDEKIEEGTQLLTHMANTMEESKDFFTPDKTREEVVIADVVAHTLPLIEKSLEARKITLQYLLDCNVSLKIFRNELMQVILNVINNAKEALLEREIPNPRIMIETVETGQFVIIKVCDNAGGIDDTIKEKIFEPYFSTKEKSLASGLGLYISKTIMETRLNGELRFENSDSGACFLIKIGKQQFLDQE